MAKPTGAVESTVICTVAVVGLVMVSASMITPGAEAERGFALQPVRADAGDIQRHGLQLRNDPGRAGPVRIRRSR